MRIQHDVIDSVYHYLVRAWTGTRPLKIQLWGTYL